jgi:hypothetical protein
MTENSEQMVSVPLELLRQVLEQAEVDNYSVENERACTPEDHAEHRKERAAIDELRRIAGIPE